MFIIKIPMFIMKILSGQKKESLLVYQKNSKWLSNRHKCS